MTSPEPEPPRPQVRDRMRDRVRTEVAETALDLFVARGFDETTVDEICAASGLARRSFFRYFRGKEDVVVSLFGRLAAEGCRSFVARPPTDDVWTALRHSMDPFVTWAEGDRPRAVAVLRLIEESTSLRAGYLDRVDAWRASLAEVVGARLGAPEGLRVEVVAAAAMGAYVAAARAWAAAGGDGSLPALFDEAFGALAPRG